MSLIKSLWKSSLRQTGVCENCMRSFTSSSRINADEPSNPFQALMKGLNEDSRSGASSRSRPRTTVATTTRANRSPGDNTAMQDIIKRSAAARKQHELSPQAVADLQRAVDRKDLERQLVRRWKAGDVYAPHDISGVEMSKWRQTERKAKPKKDVFDHLKINPIDHYKNFAIMSEYMTEMGRIKHNIDTGLRPVNQRKIAKAVRRAIGLGLMPSVHRHPEILKAEQR